MPRTLAAALRHSVSSTARSRGESYFAGGRVSTLRSDGATVSATVRGSSLYAVSLRFDGRRVVVDCTCPRFQDHLDPCKHVWAVIRAADSRRLVTVTSDLSLDVDDGGSDDDGLHEVFDDEFEDDTGSDLWGARPAPARRPMTAEHKKAVADRMKQYWAATRGGGAVLRAVPPPPPAWQTFLAGVAPPPADVPHAKPLPTGQIIYVLDLANWSAAGGVLVGLMTRDRKKSGEWAKPRAVTLDRGQISQLPDADDRRILDAVCGAAPVYGGWGGYSTGLPVPPSFVLNLTLQRDLMPRLCATGRLLLRLGPAAADSRADELVTIDWDPTPVDYVVRIDGSESAGYTVAGVLRSDGCDRTFAEMFFLTAALLLWRAREPDGRPRFAPFEPGGAERWLARLVQTGPVTVPGSETAALVEALAVSDLRRVECPDELKVESASEPPRPMVRITRPTAKDRYGVERGRLEARVSFAYGDREVDAWSPEAVLFDAERRLAVRRNREAEGGAMARLQSLGVRRLIDWQTERPRLDFAESRLPALVRVLVAEGWHIEADGQLYRQPGAMTLDVRSGIDWFELHGRVDFGGGVTAHLPALLAAVRRGDTFVTLGDGTFGLLPEEWLSRSGRMAALGTPDGDHVRFASSQTALLDAWLATEPAASCDETFTRARGELARFHGVAAADPPQTFHGVLRDYQREALGWFEFLRRFGFGGCLADEMGLGKTVMVLAALEARRVEHEHAGRPSRPSLIVVPRSLVFNWRQEAARFAPGLRVLDFTGGGRREVLDRMDEHDVVLTTYGTLRKDVGELKERTFDYAILDEAQAIKNVRTSSAKAVRLLRADHRLALSGTPIENHLGELWSLFDFLNPGLLGSASVFAAAGTARRTADDETLAMLAKGLRPFILRRTKEQVAAELPPRTEQTLFCDLEAPQRALYDELRDHYRAALLRKVASVGVGRAKLQILEALLRLRQAACHPGLIDRGRAADPSAKLDVLLPRLQELVEDGRKVLVFSQFTTLLALLKPRLDEAKLAYAYLDGKTKDRAARVQQFQENGCPLFLISLKAGGLGLNLTAAEYVFLLDPWWNPAVEAQAIDRAHRIGQTKPVFACRLIARDTVEEKVLELQAGKKRLADAIVRADESLIRDLRREDLELLLS